jgi:hypothetical protein
MFIDSGEYAVFPGRQGDSDHVKVGAAGGAELVSGRIISPAFRTEHVLTPLAELAYMGKYDADTVWFKENQPRSGITPSLVC